MTQDNDTKSGVTLAIKKFIDMVVSANFIVLIYFLIKSGQRFLVVVTSVTSIIISCLGQKNKG